MKAFAIDGSGEQDSVRSVTAVHGRSLATLPDDSPSSIGVACGLGAASSSCSYVAARSTAVAIRPTARWSTDCLVAAMDVSGMLTAVGSGHREVRGSRPFAPTHVLSLSFRTGIRKS
jgi:hypothetical protein